MSCLQFQVRDFSLWAQKLYIWGLDLKCDCSMRGHLSGWKNQGAKTFILSVGYLSGVIIDFFKEIKSIKIGNAL
mgnify:CR=1 FL=1